MISFNECVTITSSKCVKVCVCVLAQEREGVCMGVRVCVRERESEMHACEREDKVGEKVPEAQKHQLGPKSFSRLKENFLGRKFSFVPFSFKVPVVAPNTRSPVRMLPFKP